MSACLLMRTTGPYSSRRQRCSIGCTVFAGRRLLETGREVTICTFESLILVWFSFLPSHFFFLSLILSLHLSLSLPLSSSHQGCEVLGQADGPGHGQEGESHHSLCHRDGQISRLREDALWNLQARLWCEGTFAPASGQLIRKLRMNLCGALPSLL